MGDTMSESKGELKTYRRAAAPRRTAASRRKPVARKRAPKRTATYRRPAARPRSLAPDLVTPMLGKYLALKPVETKGLLGTTYAPNPEATALQSVLKSMLAVAGGARKIWRFKIGTNQTLATQSSGLINSVYNVNAVASLAEFSSLASLFYEFFVVKMMVHYEPFSEFQYPAGTLLASQYTSTPVAWTGLHHGEPAYINIGQSLNNGTVQPGNTARPKTYAWVNNERYMEGVNMSQIGTSTYQPVQGWCNTLAAPAALYWGQIQVVGNATMTSTAVVGTLLIQYHLLFRTRD